MKRYLISLLLIFLLLIVGGCKKKADNYTYYENLKYGSHERERVDLYIPNDIVGKKDCGLVLYIHGGAWISGDKEVYHDEIKERIKDGAYAYATMNYRYIDDDTDAFDIMYDVFLALEEIKKTAEENDVELTKVLLTGASAGGHIALLYAYSYFYISPFYSPIIPTCVVSFSGPAVIYNQDYYKMAALGGEAYNLFSKLSGYKYTEETYEDAFQYLAQVSPVYYTHPVPTLICHGEKDSVVPVTDAYQLDSFLTTFDVEHDLLIFPNSNHGLESDPDVMEQAQRLFKEYMVKYL